VSKKVGDGADTLFWHDRWISGVPFRVRFRCLFDLADNKSIAVGNMFSLGWEDGVRRGSGGEDCRNGRKSY